MKDLFASGQRFEMLPLSGADVSYMSVLDIGRPPEDVMAELLGTVPWREESIVVWGKTHLQPRLVAWYGDAGKAYSYSGVSLRPLTWTETLSDLKGRVEQACGCRFNSVLLNYYRDHRDSMGFHSDDEPELGPRPTIASLSLGEQRTLVFKSRVSPGPAVKVPLESGSLLLMKGDTQKNWKHGIEKLRRPCGPRVNLTFRCIRS